MGFTTPGHHPDIKAPVLMLTRKPSGGRGCVLDSLICKLGESSGMCKGPEILKCTNVQELLVSGGTWRTWSRMAEVAEEVAKIRNGKTSALTVIRAIKGF